ncbi:MULTISPECIES: DUF2239 family protein [Sphingobium]|uniref:DUF2239 family protein n=1 Tax=Sphingobium TaxID=165695 RepID=UPI0015EBEC18|nr:MULTISPECIES: DUF2239 family protein [Sphingobium]MCW2362543.1 hypothetical protein [Sphingobium sp. B10D3B]MCW2400777.1 hypothetical protein [Sphingobium sp. B10D7B]MCW2407756.1 hypothetical protein [Sphingobium xanthum]
MKTYTAFAGDLWIASGPRDHIAETIRTLAPMPRASDLLIFDDETGAQVDVDISDTALAAAPAATEARGRGRPKLGVTAREVTLLPRHWDWLAQQRTGASAVLRRLVDQAMKAQPPAEAGRDAAYRFLSAIAGDKPGFEEAIRALYADDLPRFTALAADWPVGIRDHAIGLAWPG